MTFRPNFVETAELAQGELLVGGVSDADDLPEHLIVYVEQGGHAERVEVQKPAAAWQGSCAGKGFGPGTALAFGVEVRTGPLSVITWSQLLTVEG